MAWSKSASIKISLDTFISNSYTYFTGVFFRIESNERILGIGYVILRVPFTVFNEMEAFYHVDRNYLQI